MSKKRQAKKDELTLMQRKFVNLYCESGNGTQSAIKAGYSPKNADSQASQLLAIPKVKKAIEAKEKEFEMASLITKESVLAGILQIANDKEATNSEKLNALKLLGQHLALFSEKQIIQTEQGNPFESLSDEQILKMYEEQARFTQNNDVDEQGNSQIKAN